MAPTSSDRRDNPSPDRHRNWDVGPSQNNAFQQQGSWGWIELAKSTTTWAVEILSRISAAGVDPYTLKVGQFICSQFALSQLGRQNIQNALAGLRSYGSLGDVLWFGFGARHIVRHMGNTTEENFVCLALCGVLSEVCLIDEAPAIFVELVKRVQAPAEYRPSILQWKALLQSCSGVLATTDFGTLAEELMSLNPYENRDGNLYRKLRRLSTPDSIAEALQGIAAVTRGDLVSITIIGSSDAGWLAAVSRWLFDLKVSIKDSGDQQLYGSNVDAQVVIIYEEQAKDLEMSESASRELRLSEKTYRLIHPADLFTSTWAPKDQMYHTSGRCAWDTILSNVFGSEFDLLLSMYPQALGTAIGSAARLFTYLHRGGGGYVPCDDLFEEWTTYFDSSYGRGFIDNIVQWFPEIKSLRPIMNEAVLEDFDQAKRRYEDQIGTLKLNCKCRHCTSIKPTVIHESQPGAAPSNSASKLERFCWVSILEAIISLGHLLSGLIVEPNLFPKRPGIQSIYEDVRKGRDMAESSIVDRFIPLFGAFAYVTESLRDMQRLEDRIGKILSIFSAYRPVKRVGTTPTLMAMASDGICVYMNVLKVVSDDIEISGRFHVVPGRIEHDGRAYSSLLEETSKHASHYSMDVLNSYTEACYRVTETVDSLKTYLDISNPKISALPCIHISPFRLVQNGGRYRGGTSCGRYRNEACRLVCSDLLSAASATNPPKTGTALAKQIMQIIVSGKEIQIIDGSVIARCILLGTAHTLFDGCVLQYGECIQCCLRAATKDELRRFRRKNPDGAERWLVIGADDVNEV